MIKTSSDTIIGCITILICLIVKLTKGEVTTEFFSSPESGGLWDYPKMSLVKILTTTKDESVELITTTESAVISTSSTEDEDLTAEPTTLPGEVGIVSSSEENPEAEKSPTTDKLCPDFDSLAMMNKLQSQYDINFNADLAKYPEKKLADNGKINIPKLFLSTFAINSIGMIPCDKS